MVYLLYPTLSRNAYASGDIIFYVRLNIFSSKVGYRKRIREARKIVKFGRERVASGLMEYTMTATEIPKLWSLHRITLNSANLPEVSFLIESSSKL